MKQKERSDGSADPCADLLRTSDESRWLAVQFAPEAERPRLAAIFAFAVEIAKVPRAVSAPPLGEIRLAWWREGVEALAKGAPPRAHPVLASLAANGVIAPQALPLALRMIKARIPLLYQSAFSSFADFLVYCADAEGALARLAAGEDGSAGDALELAGGAYGLARDAARLAPAFVAEARGECARRLESAAQALRALPAQAANRALYLRLARVHLRNGEPPSPLAMRLALFHAALTGRVLG